MRTFSEHDILSFGFNLPPAQLRRFWMMLTHYHGQVFNSATLGQSLGISSQIARRYLDILQDTLMIRILPPWHENTKKRHVKSPKVYFRDSGLFHFLAGLHTIDRFLTSSLLGASSEGFALEQTLQLLEIDPYDCWFWSVHNQVELDLLIFKGGRRYGFKFQYTDHPTPKKSMYIAKDNLKIEKLLIIHPGDVSWQIDEITHAIGFQEASLILSSLVKG